MCFLPNVGILCFLGMEEEAMTHEAKPAQLRKVSSPANGGASGYGFLFEANQRAFARWFQGISALSQEITQFTQSRLQEDMAAWSTLARCKSPEDAFECQRHFAEKATSQYSEEITKLSRLMAGLATDGLASLQRSADTTS